MAGLRTFRFQANLFLAAAFTLVLFQNCGSGFSAQAPGVSSLANAIGNSVEVQFGAARSARNSSAANQPGTVLLYSYHYYAGGQGDFIYRPNSDNTSLQSQGYVSQGPAFSVLSAAANDTVLLRECHDANGFRFLSVTQGCEGYKLGGTLGYIYISPVANSVAILRYVNPGTFAHMTVRADSIPAGIASTGLQLEGPLGYVPK